MRPPGPRLLVGILLAVLLVGCARESSEGATIAPGVPAQPAVESPVEEGEAPVVAKPLPKAPEGVAEVASSEPLE